MSVTAVLVTIYNSRPRMTLRVLLAFFAGVTCVITTILIPVAYFGDKKSTLGRATGNHRVHCRRDLNGRDLLRSLTIIVRRFE